MQHHEAIVQTIIQMKIPKHQNATKPGPGSIASLGNLLEAQWKKYIIIIKIENQLVNKKLILFPWGKLRL